MEIKSKQTDGSKVAFSDRNTSICILQIQKYAFKKLKISSRIRLDFFKNVQKKNMQSITFAQELIIKELSIIFTLL